MTRNPRRPAHAPRPRITRTAVPIGALAAVATVFALVLATGMVEKNAPVTASGSPSGNAPASSAPSTVPSGLATPAPVATLTPKAVSATRVIDGCSSRDGTLPAVNGHDLWFVCYDGDDHPYFARVDMTTNTLRQTVPALNAAGEPFVSIDHVFVSGNSLWFDGSMVSQCTTGSCGGLGRAVRIDLTSGKVALDLGDGVLMGFGDGFIWLADYESLTGTLSASLHKLDPATGVVVGTIPFEYRTLDFACGSMWGTKSDLNPAQPFSANSVTTAMARLDPASGAVLAQFTVGSSIGTPQQVGNECWAAASTDPTAARDHFVRIGQSGIEGTSPIVADGTDAEATIMGDDFWVFGGGPEATWLGSGSSEAPGSPVTITRLDPATWLPVDSRTWIGQPPLFAAGGSLWAGDDPDNFGNLDRLAIP